MHVAIRSVAAGLPRVSMARIPVVVFANHSHPSAYSSSAWSESAKNTADKLERAAKNLGNEVDQASGLSQHASEAIRLVESHSVLKQDKATIHAYRDVDHSETRFLKQ